MKLDSNALAIEEGVVEKRIIKFLQARLAESGRKGFVIGLSGGLDSSTAATLCARAVQPANVMGLIMPHRESSLRDKEDALLLAEKLGISYKILDITNAVDAIEANLPDPRDGGIPQKDAEQELQNTIGNIKARVRMINLYMAANHTDRLVVGSGDKSEFLIGYFTKYGDGGADIFPIADLYKTQVRSLARFLGVPDAITAKPSTPGLWKGQTAEQEIGFRYEQLDLILLGLERFMNAGEIADQLNIPIETVAGVERLLKKTEHKRRGGIVLKIGYRTPTLDWRIPL